MKIAVLGAGSWGTTVASRVAPRHDTVLWARNPDVAKAVNTEHANSAYLPGFGLAPELSATADLDQAVCDADLVVVGRARGGDPGRCRKTLRGAVVIRHHGKRIRPVGYFG